MSRETEVAEKTLAPSIIEAAFNAAKMYPELRIRCPWCGLSVLGVNFDEHGHEHQKGVMAASGRKMTAIVLAGGKGSRLAPWTAPKCLMPVNGLTILHRLLMHLLVKHKETIDKVIICTGYREHDVRLAVASYCWTSSQIIYSEGTASTPMGTRLIEARKLVDVNARLLICYGDELADVDIEKLLETHISDSERAMTFTIAHTTLPGGTVFVEGGRARIIEDQKKLTNIGFVVVEPHCWEHLYPEDGLSTWINRVQNVNFYHHEGRRATINTLVDLAAAEELWK